MIIKHVTQAGNPVIRAKAKPVKNPCAPATKRIVKNLVDSMRYHELVGMSAPQVGESVRIFVTEIRKTKVRKGEESTDQLRVFINPKILATSKNTFTSWEGCGSVAFANLFGQVKRSSSVTVEAISGNGELFTLKATGLLAAVIQHEIDHLNGILFCDKADQKTFMSRDEYLKMKNVKVS